MTLCECGCGEPTNIITHTNTKRGDKKGNYYKFVRGHHVRIFHPTQDPNTRKKMSESLKGRPLSEEHKRKLSKIRMGMPSCRKGITQEMEYGIEKTKEIKRKQRETMKKHWRNPDSKYNTEEYRKKRPDLVGKKNPNWQGGKSFEPYTPEFDNNLKELIRKRDNLTCQECAFIEEWLGYTLPIHHIDYNKKNNNPNNLILLCRSCHSKTNFNRENWIEYYQNKIGGIR